nr:hypothetical protein GCM10020092_083050 [Actinoplanes digitatis]
MIRSARRLAQAVRSVGHHDAGNAEALDGLRAPEVGAVEQLGLLLEAERGEQGRDIECHHSTVTTKNLRAEVLATLGWADG